VADGEPGDTGPERLPLTADGDDDRLRGRDHAAPAQDAAHVFGVAVGGPGLAGADLLGPPAQAGGGALVGGESDGAELHHRRLADGALGDPLRVVAGAAGFYT
jgi:hypothetical protein